MGADPEPGSDFHLSDVNESDGDHFMSTIVNVLQTIGVGADDATNYAVHAMKGRSMSACEFAKTCNPVLPPYHPSIFEIYGHGNILRASHGCRRNLNINGLHAMDLRTAKPSG